MASTPSNAARPLRLLISAGEASGEMYGAALLEALRRMAGGAGFSGVECFGVGGELMRHHGCDTVVDANKIAVVGLAEVVRHLPSLYGEFHKLLREVDRRKPDVAVLVDFPDWNFRLAKQLHRRGITVVWYISPQLWAWRKHRIRLVQKYVKKMLVIFPFELEFYRGHGVEAEFVGHPLADLEPTAVTREEFAARYKLDPAKQWIGLMPGSRKGEVSRHLQLLYRVVNRLTMDDWEDRGHQGGIFGGPQFVLPVASTLRDTELGRRLQRGFPIEDHKFPMKITLVPDAREALAHCRAAVVASGTATVETAVLGTPFVMVYRVSPLTYTVGKRLVNVPFYGMVNLIAGRKVVPELIQQDFTPERVVSELRELIPDGPRRSQMLADLAEVKGKLRGSSTGLAAENAARAVLETLRG